MEHLKARDANEDQELDDAEGQPQRHIEFSSVIAGFLSMISSYQNVPSKKVVSRFKMDHVVVTEGTHTYGCSGGWELLSSFLSQNMEIAMVVPPAIPKSC